MPRERDLCVVTSVWSVPSQHRVSDQRVNDKLMLRDTCPLGKGMQRPFVCVGGGVAPT